MFPENIERVVKGSISTKKNPNITINEKRKIVDKVKKLSKDVHMEIFYFLKKKINEEYTINQNGVFINLNTIDNDTLFSLREMVNFYNKNEKNLKESYLERYCNKNSKNEKDTIDKDEEISEDSDFSEYEEEENISEDDISEE